VSDADHAWTAGQRSDMSDGTSAFVWRLVSSSDYSELPVNFTNWNGGEPHRSQCIAMLRSRNYMWFDVSCGERYNTVCEIRVARN